VNILMCQMIDTTRVPVAVRMYGRQVSIMRDVVWRSSSVDTPERSLKLEIIPSSCHYLRDNR